jgi:SAM-dependent methyltransferase
VREPGGGAPDPLTDDLAVASASANPAVLPPETRAALPKRWLLRLLRLYTSGQIVFNHALVRIVGALDARQRSLDSRLERLDALAVRREGQTAQRLAGLENAAQALEAAVRRLEIAAPRLADRIDRISPPTPDQLFVKGAYVEFENQFRGSRDEIRERQKFYLPFFREAARRVGPGARFLDLGSGRGELLELAAGAGLAMTGVDSEAAMIESCRARGLEAQRGDLLEVLAGWEESSLSGISALQVVEHLSWAAVRTLVDLAYQRLRSGGCLVLETVNPASAFGMRAFYLDPTHRQPVPSEIAHFLLAQAGFGGIETHFLNPVDDPKLASALEGSEPLMALADVLLGFRDYAIVGWKP